MKEHEDARVRDARDWRARRDRGGHSGLCDGPGCRRRLDALAAVLARPADDAWFCGHDCAEDWDRAFRIGGS